MSGALCAPENLVPGASVDDWFAQPGTPEARRAMTACLDCPLYWDCRDHARAEGIPSGIFGGEAGAARRRHWKLTGGRPKDHMLAYNEHLAILGARKALSPEYDADYDPQHVRPQTCRGGHALDDAIVSGNGKRQCRACRKAQARKNRERRAAA